MMNDIAVFKNKQSFFLVLLASFLLSACTGNRPENLLASSDQFVDCPSSPNCVSSDASNDSHKMSAWVLNESPELVWKSVKAQLSVMPRVSIVQEKDFYLHAEATSLFFRFVDDVQFQIRQDKNEMAIYSASRLGRSDFGVNKKRLEEIKKALLKSGMIKEK